MLNILHTRLGTGQLLRILAFALSVQVKFIRTIDLGQRKEMVCGTPIVQLCSNFGAIKPPSLSPSSIFILATNEGKVTWDDSPVYDRLTLITSEDKIGAGNPLSLFLAVMLVVPVALAAITA
jgi:hypothetical protein